MPFSTWLPSFVSFCLPLWLIPQSRKLLGGDIATFPSSGMYVQGSGNLVSHCVSRCLSHCVSQFVSHPVSHCVPLIFVSSSRVLCIWVLGIGTLSPSRLPVSHNFQLCSSCLPGVFQLSHYSHCLPLVTQLFPSCRTDVVSQLSSHCLPPVSQLRPSCLPDVSRMWFQYCLPIVFHSFHLSPRTRFPIVWRCIPFVTKCGIPIVSELVPDVLPRFSPSCLPLNPTQRPVVFQI